MRLFPSFRRRPQCLREAVAFRPRLEALEDRLTPDSRLLADPIVSLIGPGQSFMTYTNSAIDQANDIYLYQFQATAGFWFSAQTATAVGNGVYFPTNLRLFDSTGTEITADVGNNGPSTNVLLDTVIPATGTYYLGLAGGTNTSYDPTTGAGAAGGVAGNYNLHMSLWQMTGTVNAGRTFTVTGSPVGGNQLEFYPYQVLAGQSVQVTASIVYHLPGDPNLYYAFNPPGVINYRFDMGAGAGNQVVATSGDPFAYHYPVNASMWQNGAQISFGPVGYAGYTANISGAQSIYLYGNIYQDGVVMFDTPQTNIFSATPGYASLSAAPGAVAPYVNCAAGFGSVRAQRYFATAIDLGYFYGGRGDYYTANPGSAYVTFGVMATAAEASAPHFTAYANGFDATAAYDLYPSPTTGRGSNVASFTDGPGNDVYYATSPYAYMTGPSPFVAGRSYFNTVYTFGRTVATSQNGGNDIAFLLDPVNNMAINFAQVITS